MNQPIEIVITDLDKTLLNDEHIISDRNMETLKWLGKKKIKRVISTGRSLFSAKKAIADNLPIDYLIFSSGAGIIDWHTKEIIFSQSLQKEVVSAISDYLVNNKFDFMVHEPIPENHKFTYHHSGNENPDFMSRYFLYKDFAFPLHHKNNDYQDSCQILVVIPQNLQLFEKVSNNLSTHEIKIIRTTSPLDGNYIWVEIFPQNISKGHSAEWLCEKLGINQTNTMGIGNDYNDIDLLDWTANSFIVANAPDDLKSRYKVCKSNFNNGFTDAVLAIIK